MVNIDMASQDKSNDEMTTQLHHLQKELDSMKKLYSDSVRVSEQKQKDLIIDEEAIMDHHSRLELAVDAVDMAWWDMDVITGNVIFHKRKAEMLGYPPEQFHHYTDFTTLVHPDDQEGAMNAMRDHLRGKAKNYEIEYRIKTFAGAYRWFYDIGTVVKRDVGGMPQKIIGFVMDITTRKQAELEIKNKNAELQRINSEKDKFFSIIAHDLRGPLGGLLEVTNIMSDKSINLDEMQRKELFAALGNTARNTFSLLENLLEWSQIQRGHIQFNPKTINLNDLVIDSVYVFAETARLKEIDVFMDIPVETYVNADRQMLQTVFRNLISNAIKFTRQGGKISISARLNENKGTVVSVKDSGIGMTEELRTNLFRLDVNIKRPGTNGESSTGLGLQLCKEFVEKHGGKLWVESEVEKGSIFYFDIPS